MNEQMNDGHVQEKISSSFSERTPTEGAWKDDAAVWAQDRPTTAATYARLDLTGGMIGAF